MSSTVESAAPRAKRKFLSTLTLKKIFFLGAAAARRRQRLAGRLLTFVALTSPFLWSLTADASRRAKTMLGLYRGTGWYFRASMAFTLLFWVALLWPAASRRGPFRHVFGALFVLVFTLALGVQGGFWACFTTYLTPDAEIFSHSLLSTLFGTLPLGNAAVWFHLLLSAMGSLLILRVARKTIRPTRWQRWIGPPIALAFMAAMVRAPASYRSPRTSVSPASQEQLYFVTIVDSFKEQRGKTALTVGQLRPQRRSPEHVPKLEARPSRPRNVLFILQESERYDVTCVDYDPDCKLANQASNQAAPARMGLHQVRSLDSSTFLSFSTLMSGRLPSEPVKELQSAPLIWSYARAGGYHTAYFTSQHLVYNNMRLLMEDEPFDQFACATTVEQEADFDAGANDSHLTDYALAHLDQLPEPFFAVVHYSNNHWPYVYDPKRLFFKSDPKAVKSKIGPDDHYRNVVYLSDLAVGRLIQRMKQSAKGARTDIVFTSDHAEGYAEHGYGGHTLTVFDSEIHVPTWIDAAPGTLTSDEEASIRKARDEIVYHVDLSATFLDLMGLWDAPGLAPFRARMVGHPLTRPERTTAAVPLTNCSWIHECHGSNWGFMQGSRKIVGNQGATAFHCYDVLADPGELTDLHEDGCRDLVDAAAKLFYPLNQKPPPHFPRN
jgi:glucan phosphoethanolaminetransferase (alkaline phosphatase superfamily)